MERERIETPFAAAACMMEVFNYVQNRAWSSLPAAKRRTVDAITPRQQKTMMLVYMNDVRGNAPMTLGELALRLGLKKAAASILVSGLVEKKLLARRTDSENRRFVRISLAAKGRATGDAIVGAGAEQTKRLFSKLGDAETAAFCASVEKVRDAYLEALRS